MANRSTHAIIAGLVLFLSAVSGKPAGASYLSTLQGLGGLVSHWGFEELAGETVVDSIVDDSVDGNNPGTVSGSGVTMDVAGPRPSDGFAGFSPANNAIDFNGDVSQRLLMNPEGYTGADGLTEATMSMWFRITDTDTTKHYHLGGLESSSLNASGRYTMALNHYSGANGLRAFGRVANSPSAEIPLSTSNGAAGPYLDGSWHHAVTTFKQVGPNRMLNLYVDGVLKDDDSAGANALDALSSRDSLSFGYDVGSDSTSSGGARAMVGQLDEIAFHDHALTSAEVLALYQSALDYSVAADPNLPTMGISAHRGASQTHPENTLTAFEEAVDLGAHQIEFDVRRTSDGELVLMHDSTVDRTTNGTGSVSGLTLAQIKSLDAGSWKGAEFTSEKVPTLAEALDMMPLNVWLNVHVKGDYALGYAVAQEIAAHGRLHQAFVSGEVDEATGARAAVPDILINNLDRQSGDTTAYVEATIAQEDDFIQLHKDNPFPTPSQITDLQAAGVQINYYGSNDPNQLATLFADGVEFVLADDLGSMMSQAILEGIDPVLPIYRGDFNQDGLVNQDDISLFVQALTDRNAFQATYADFDVNLYGDFNLDGKLDLGDIQGFREAIASPNGTGSAIEIPEPNTVTLLTTMLLIVASSLRRQSRER